MRGGRFYSQRAPGCLSGIYEAKRVSFGDAASSHGDALRQNRRRQVTDSISILDHVTPEVRRILRRALDNVEISWQEALQLCQVSGLELHALQLVADEMRRRQVGETVTYVVNRNINFTNVCSKHCGFCAFSRTYSNQEGYFLPIEEIIRRTREATDLGATE